MSQCSTLGLLPFNIRIAGTFQPTRCDEDGYSAFACSNVECTGTVPCGGCSPCDPNGTAPGANGRKCPCKDQDCPVPTDRQLPVQECLGGLVANYCDYVHADFWYLTSCTADEPCEVETESCCPWLGSVSCALALVRYPAGAVRVTPGPLTGTWTGAAQYANCAGTVLPPPWIGGPLFGTTESALECASGAPCPCACTCHGLWVPVQLQDTPGEFDCSANPKYLYAQIVWAIPCGGPGVGSGLLCGGGCGDSCAASYIAVRYYGTSYQGRNNVVLGNWGPGMVCEDMSCDGQVFTCGPVCCESQTGITIIYRLYRDATTMTPPNYCQMQKGVYEPIGVGLCGNLGQTLDCRSAECIQARDLCDSPGAWEKALAQLGVISSTVEIY